MFDELEKILSEDSSEDSWYDDGYIYVEELLENFTNNDWEKLINTVKNKNDKYKIRLAYCIDEDTGINGFNVLLKLLNEHDEVVEYALDSLRSFDGKLYRNLIMSDRTIIDKAENLLKNASSPIKLILEKFLKQNK